MSKKGYIKLDRKILDNMLWVAKPFDYAHAWVDLLLLANHKDIDVIRKGRVMHRKRGDVDTSINFLAERWGWSPNKVRRYIRALSGTGMCTPNGTPYGTTLTIENYTKYQGGVRADGTPNETSNGTPDGTPDGTHDKNVKEWRKNIKNAHARENSFSSLLDELEKEADE